jgi:succinylglutamate desuccinylase
MHGQPEVVGLALLESLQEQPIEGWDTVIANEAAFAAQARFVTHNMAMMFGEAEANANADDYELRRPAELLELAWNRKLVLDIHDQPTNSLGEFIAVGEKLTDPRLLVIAALLNIDNVVIYRERKRIAERLPNTAVTVELSRSDDGRFVRRSVKKLRECMGTVALLGVDGARSFDVNRLNYFERVMEIPMSYAKEIGLPERGRIGPFDPIPLGTLALLERNGRPLPDGIYVASYWNNRSSSPDWFGDVLRRVPSPF